MNIQYNPWEEKYKKPFGAVKNGSKVTFSLNVLNTNVNQIQLYMEEEYSHKEKIFDLERQQNGSTYRVTLTISTGLYFYHFIVKYTENNRSQIVYFGRNGTVDTINQVSQYQLTVFDKDVPHTKWYQEGICYQIFPDSFYASKTSSILDTNSKKDILIYGNKTDLPLYIKDKNGDILRWTFYGGNLNGIIKKIPYLKSLGIDCIYLNPIFQSTSPHRYDTDDYFKIDDLLGNEKDFKKLIRALHKNNMHLILDGVFDHVGSSSRYFNKFKIYGNHQGAFQSKTSQYYPWFTFNSYPHNYQCWWGVQSMPQIRKNSQSFHDFIAGNKGVIDYWTHKGVDGWRIDVADELTDDFIHQIRQRLNHFSDKVLVGEVWEDASNKISYNQRRKYVLGNTLDGSMNYPLRKGIVHLLNDQRVNLTALDWMHLYENYPHEYMLNCLNNIGTHDTKRILTVLDGNLLKLEIAVGLLFMFPGVPCIYYGDEAGLKGDKDPDNRAYYPWGRENQTVFNIYKKWIVRRKRSLAMRKGELSIFVCGSIIGIIRYFKQSKINVYFANCISTPVEFQPSELEVYRNSSLFKDFLIQNYGKRKLSGFESVYYEGKF